MNKYVVSLSVDIDVTVEAHDEEEAKKEAIAFAATIPQQVDDVEHIVITDEGRVILETANEDD